MQTQANSNQLCFFIIFVWLHFSASNIYCQIMQQISKTLHVLSCLYGNHGRPVVVSALTLWSPISTHKFSEVISLHFLKHDILCLQEAITNPEGGSRGYPYFKISPYRWPTQARKDWPHRRGLRLLLFKNNGVGFPTSHKNQISESAAKTGPTVFHPYPRRLESLTVSHVITKA